MCSRTFLKSMWRRCLLGQPAKVQKVEDTISAQPKSKGKALSRCERQTEEGPGC